MEWLVCSPFTYQVSVLSDKIYINTTTVVEIKKYCDNTKSSLISDKSYWYHDNHMIITLYDYHAALIFILAI